MLTAYQPGQEGSSREGCTPGLPTSPLLAVRQLLSILGMLLATCIQLLPHPSCSAESASVSRGCLSLLPLTVEPLQPRLWGDEGGC